MRRRHQAVVKLGSHPLTFRVGFDEGFCVGLNVVGFEDGGLLGLSVGCTWVRCKRFEWDEI